MERRRKKEGGEGKVRTGRPAKRTSEERKTPPNFNTLSLFSSFSFLVISCNIFAAAVVSMKRIPEILQQYSLPHSLFLKKRGEKGKYVDPIVLLQRQRKPKVHLGSPRRIARGVPPGRRSSGRQFEAPSRKSASSLSFEREACHTAGRVSSRS